VEGPALAARRIAVAAAWRGDEGETENTAETRAGRRR